MNLSIALDCDGILRNFTSSVSRVGKKHGVDITSEPTEWSYIFNIPHKDKTFGNYAFTEYAQDIFENASVIEGAKEAYQKFVNNDKLNVYIVTTQTKDNEQYTLNWLEKNGFEGHEDVLFLRDKTKAHCNVLIDDKPSNVLSYQKAVRMGILLNQPWNKNAEGIHRRVNNLNEAYNLILSYI